MFDDDGMKNLEKYMIYWIVFSLLTAGVVDMFDINLSETYWSLYLQKNIPAINKLNTSSKYPEFAITLWTVFWTVGPVYIISLLLFFKDSVIKKITTKLIVLIFMMLLVSIVQLYFGIYTSMPDKSSGSMSQFMHLTYAGNIVYAFLGWVLLISSIISFTNLFKK